MNAVDGLLREEVGRLMDRLAATVPVGSLEATSGANPTLRARLDDMEVSLASARATLLADYGRWRGLLDDLENLWALAAWRSAAPEEPSEYSAPRAA
jgi:hypothetical protein